MADIKINEILYNDIFNLIKTAKENERAVYGDALIDNLSNKLKKI